MTKTLPLAAAFLLLASASAFAAESVTFTMKANMQSLRDPTRKDEFTVGLADKQVETQLKITCQAGKRGFLRRQDESCAVAGNGQLINPTNQQKLQRTQYAGGWVVKSDGYTEGANMSINYLAVGKVPASAATFGGSMMLKPENPGSGATALKDAILKNIKSKETGLIDERVDTIQLANFFIPSGGLPSDKGCTWNGNMAYSYQTESWFMDITAKCGAKDFALKGNMPFTASPGTSGQSQYDLTLTLPSADAGTDDALFAAPTGDQDLFAAADGISGQIIMKEGGKVTVQVDGQPEELASEIDGTGTLNGQNVPLETVRSLSILIGVMSRTFFGA